MSQNHWGLFLRGYWFNSSLHWWKKLLTRAVGSRRAAGTGGDGSGGAAGTDTWQKFLLGNLPLAPALHLLQMEDSEGWRDFLIYFFKKKKRQNIEKIFIECKRKPSDQRPALDPAWNG